MNLVGKAAIRLISAATSSGGDGFSKYIRIDNLGERHESSKEDLLWNAVEMFAHYDADRITLNTDASSYTTGEKCWVIEMWNDHDKANPEVMFYLYR